MITIVRQRTISATAVCRVCGTIETKTLVDMEYTNDEMKRIFTAQMDWKQESDGRTICSDCIYEMAKKDMQAQQQLILL